MKAYRGKRGKGEGKIFLRDLDMKEMESRIR
jgi:hypothetical protein